MAQTKTVAFLRAINVGGRRLKMDELRLHFEQMGFANVETFIASGNVIFDAPPGQALAADIEAYLHAQLGYPVTTFIRTVEEVAAIAGYRPFDETLMAQGQALNIALLAAPLPEQNRQALQQLRTPIDEFHTHEREIYWLCRVKQSESEISNTVLERALGVAMTLRTHNTFARLAAKYG